MNGPVGVGDAEVEDEVDESEVVDVLDETSEALVEEILELEVTFTGFFLYKLSLEPAPQYS